MSEENSTARGMIALSVAGILAKILSIIYTPALRGILTTAGYGIYTQTTAVFVFVYAVACMGAQPALAKTVSEYVAVGNEKSAIRALQISRKLFMGIGSILALLMVALAVPISNIAKNPAIAYGIVALAPCVVITTYLATIRGYMQGKNNMKAIAISQIVEQIVNIGVSLVCAYILVQISVPLGSAGAQIGTSVAALFACIYLVHIFMKNRYKEKADSVEKHKKISDKRILKKIITYSLPIIISAGLQNFGMLVDMLNVGTRLLHAGYDDISKLTLIGLLGMYNTLYGVPLVIITAVGMSALPAISKLFVLNEKHAAKKKIRESFKLTYIIAIPSAVGLSILSTDIYISLFGSAEGSGLMKIGAFIILLMATTQIQSVVLQSINKMYFMIGAFVIGLTLKILLNYVFVGIAYFNIYGVLIGNLFWHLIPAILNHKKICKTMNMKMPIINLIARPMLASIVMGLVIYLIQLPYSFIYTFITPCRLASIPITFVAIAIGGVIYLYLMIVMGGIRKSDIEAISPKIMRFMPRGMRIKLK